MRKWQYIAKFLELENAPVKITNAAKEIDNILVGLGLGGDTSAWNSYDKFHNYKEESWDGIHDIINNTSFCPACVICGYNCENCILGDEERCTPRDKYADNYFLIVSNYVCRICEKL